MQFKRRTAVRPKKALNGKRLRGVLSWKEAVGRSDEDILDLMDRGYVFELAGGTTSSNTVMANPIYLPKATVVSTDQTVNQGDMVWWDPVNYTLKPLTTPTAVAVSATGGFIGVAQGQANPNVYPTPAAGTPAENLPGMIVQRGGTVKVHSTTGDGSYYPYEPVTVGADAQTVTRGGQTTANRVGFVIVPLPSSARGAPGATPAPETVAGGTDLELWIEPKFPGTYLL